MGIDEPESEGFVKELVELGKRSISEELAESFLPPRSCFLPRSRTSLACRVLAGQSIVLRVLLPCKLGERRHSMREP